MNDAKLDPVSQARIGAKLRAVYDGLPDEPVPEHLRHLIEVLEGLEFSASRAALAPDALELMQPIGTC